MNFLKSSEDWILQGWEDEEGPTKMTEKEQSIMLGKNQDGKMFRKSSEGSVSKRRNWGIRIVKRSMEQNWNPEINSYIYGQLIFDQGTKIIQLG